MLDFLSQDIIRLILLIIFGAFLVFYLLYSFFTIYHAIRYGFKEDKLTFPVMIIFVAGSAALILLALFLFGIF